MRSKYTIREKQKSALEDLTAKQTYAHWVRNVAAESGKLVPNVQIDRLQQQADKTNNYQFKQSSFPHFNSVIHLQVPHTPCANCPFAVVL